MMAKAVKGKSNCSETLREGMSPAVSIPVQRNCEVHPGADSAKKVAGYVSHTLRAGKVKDLHLLLEWNRGKNFVSRSRRSFFVPRTRMFERTSGLQDIDKERKMGIISYIKEEIQVIRERDPAIKSNMEVFLYPSFKVILRYRVAHRLYLKKHYFLARWISQRAARKTGIEIHPGATIGRGLFIDHGSGVIIGETTVIGDNVTLYQGVTLGGTGKEQGKRHPTLKDNVMVSAGAKILGSFTIGENSKIGAGSVVLEEVPPNCTVVGVPGRVVRMGSRKVPRSDMDQIHLPDPVLNDIRALQEENVRLHSQLKSMVKYMKCLEKEGYDCGNREQSEKGREQNEDL